MAVREEVTVAAAAATDMGTTDPGVDVTGEPAVGAGPTRGAEPLPAPMPAEPDSSEWLSGSTKRRARRG